MRFLSLLRPLYVMITVMVFAAAGCAHLPRLVVLHDPLSPEEHFQLALAYEKKKEYDLALKEYDEVLKKKTLLGDAYANMANIYFLQGKEQLSESFYLKAIHENPSDGKAYNNLSWLYLTLNKNLDRAEALLREAIQKDPPNVPYYLDTLASVYEKEGRWTLALETLEKAEKSGFGDNPGAEIQFYAHLEKVLSFSGYVREADRVHQKIEILKDKLSRETRSDGR